MILILMNAWTAWKGFCAQRRTPPCCSRRIQRGVKPLEDIGPAIARGKSYTLHISQDWQDGRGIRLVNEFRKSFEVAGPDRTPVNPLEWRVVTPTQHQATN